jgi:hypothetical protein
MSRSIVLHAEKRLPRQQFARFSAAGLQTPIGNGHLHAELQTEVSFFEWPVAILASGHTSTAASGLVLAHNLFIKTTSCERLASFKTSMRK